MAFNICHQFERNNTPLPFYGNYFVTFAQFYAPIHEVLAIIIIVLGLISNASLLAVLTRKKMSSPTNTFLIGISIADSCVLMSYFCIWLPLIMYKVFSYEFTYAYATMLPPYIIYRGVSSLLTVLLALWRVASLYFPFQSSIKLNESNAIRGTLICFIVCHLLFIPQTCDFEVTYKNCTPPPKRIGRTFYHIHYRHDTMRSIGFFNASIMTQLIPCLILITSTIAILVKLKAARTRRAALKNSPSDEKNQTENALLAILVLFLICELPLGIVLMLNIVEKRFYSVLLSLFHFTAMLRLLNASLNFIMYCTMSSLFRTTFKEVVSNVITELTSQANATSASGEGINSVTSKKEVSIELKS